MRPHPAVRALEKLQEEYGDKGFSVLGFPCNQFLGQEPGTAEEIQAFCSTTYGVTFPLFEKIEVNGDDRHPLYAELTEVADTDGDGGDIQWNFEKFLVAPGGEVVGRFRPTVAARRPRGHRGHRGQPPRVAREATSLDPRTGDGPRVSGSVDHHQNGFWGRARVPCRLRGAVAHPEFGVATPWRVILTVRRS